MPTTVLPIHYWHATPLAHLPTLLETGALRCARDLPAGIRPRSSAPRRQRLGLDGFIHLSLQPVTALLLHQRRLGIAHALIAFGADVALLPGAGWVRYNTKAWRHRDAFAPVTDPAERGELLRQWRGGHLPSLELVVPDTLPLTLATGIYLATTQDAAWLSQQVGRPDLPPILVSPRWFPQAAPALDPPRHDAL